MRRLCAVLAVPALMLAGCGESPGFDADSVESFLVTSQADTFGTGAEVTGASCPDDPKLSEGMKVTCTLDVSGSEIPYAVTLTHVTEDPVTVKAELDAVVVAPKALRDYLVGSLDKAAANGVEVSCGGGAFLVAQVDDEVECEMVVGAQTRTVKLRIEDDRGTVTVVG